MRRTTPIDVRFWRKVDKSSGPAACWPWLGATAETGYGKFQAGTNRQTAKAVRAPRLSWELTNGPIPAGQEIRHKCDNRICVNPSHLEPGTRSDNMQDMYSRGRQGHRGAPGERNGRAQITADQARELKAAYASGIRACDLARAYGVSYTLAWQVAKGRCWKHVTA